MGATGWELKKKKKAMEDYVWVKVIKLCRHAPRLSPDDPP